MSLEGRLDEPTELRKIEGEDKYALMTPSQKGVARLDAAREVVAVLREGKRPKNELRRIGAKTEGATT